MRAHRPRGSEAGQRYLRASRRVWAAGLTALQGLQTGKIHAGQKVLINGASGGVGTFALQIAKAFDTEVTAVVQHAQRGDGATLGADHVVDYTKEDFTKREERYDLIFDNVNNRSFSERRRLLNARRHLRLRRDWRRRVARRVSWDGSLGTSRRALRSRFMDQKFERYITKRTTRRI